MELDKEQKAAVETKKRNVLVVSCPGSGKTRCLTERLKFLLNNNENPAKIFAITYTNAAAQEMRNRVDNQNIFIGTIHSLANRILILNGIDTSDYLKDEEFDMLFNLLSDKELEIPEVDHLLVDEFQDVNENEYYFITNILKPKNFFYCGDSCQSIFSYSGSNYKYFMDILNDPFTTSFQLKNNYRCGKEIIDFANIFLEGMYDVYRVFGECKSGIIGEVEKIPFSLHQILSYFSKKDYKDWFILCRTNAQIEQITSFLTKNNIPCVNFKQSELSYSKLKETINSEQVKVLTIHSAKGLENKNVLVIGAKTWNAEEKRICYVAATRAKEKLVWMTEMPKKKPNYKMQNWG